MSRKSLLHENNCRKKDTDAEQQPETHAVSEVSSRYIRRIQGSHSSQEHLSMNMFLREQFPAIRGSDSCQL